MLGEIEKNEKKVEFLNSVIKEKTEKISALEEELSRLRKKNGKGFDADIYIYQTNMKILAEKKAISACKSSVKQLREESGEILRTLYAEEKGYRERQDKKKRFFAISGGKAELVDDTEEGEVVALFGVATKDRRLSGRSAILIKAGIRTTRGKLLKKAEVGGSEFDKKKTDGATIEENYPKEVTLKIGEEKGFFAKIVGLFKGGK